MSLPTPILLDLVLDDPERLRWLLERSAPYPNQLRSQPAAGRAAAAVAPPGHPFAMPGGAPPLFRGDWVVAGQPIADVADLAGSPILHEAAGRLWGGRTSPASFLYVNLTAPMPRLDAGHVDVPAFRGMDRRNAPGWFLLAMGRSGLFTSWAIRRATAVAWFYGGPGGELRYWPQGADQPSQVVAPVPNTGIVGDNDHMFHRVEAVGDPQLWHPVSRHSELHHVDGSRWEIRDGGDVLAGFEFEQLRISLSWKAEVLEHGADVPEGRAGPAELAPISAVEQVASELRARQLWDGRRPELEDPAFVEAVMAAFPRTVPIDDAR